MTQIHNDGISIRGDLDGYSSLISHKCTLVPSRYFDTSRSRDLLASTVPLEAGEAVGYLQVSDYDAVLVYSGATAPELYNVLKALPSCQEYNKILASYGESYLHLAIARGGSLLLANVYYAQDFTTAQYYLFLAMKALQLNPEVSTVCWRTALSEDERMSLYRYFKAVEQL